MYFTLDSGPEKGKCQKIKEWDIKTRNSSRFSPVLVKQTKRLALRSILCLADRIDERLGIVKFLLVLQIKHFSGKRLTFQEIQ